MSTLNYLALIVYTLLLFVGGIIGYLKSGSFISLITAGSFTLILLIAIGAAYKKAKWGIPLALTCVSLLTVFFCYRYFLTGAFMPAGLMVILGIVTLACEFIYRKKHLLKES